MSVHTDRDVLETCAKTLEYLCREGSATYTRCDVARSNIIDNAVNKYKDSIEDWHVDECQSKENPGRNLPNEALTYCIEACYFAISWGLYYIENQCETSQIAEAVAELRKNLDKYMFACYELTRDGPTEQIQEAAYQSICDLLITFSDQLSRSENTHVRNLEYKSTLDEQLVLNNFVQHYVFSLKQEGDVPEDPVTAPKRLLFLEVLNEFNHKLLKQDKKVILNFLDRRISPGMPSSKPDDYQPLNLYRNSLLHGETDQAPVSSKRAYARKRRDHDDEKMKRTTRKTQRSGLP
ncbi:Cohesin subunit SA-2, partial [Eumeta japonica]